MTLLFLFSSLSMLQQMSEVLYQVVSIFTADESHSVELNDPVFFHFHAYQRSMQI